MNYECMKISEIINYLQSLAPLSLQEKYDNAGLLTGDPEWECSGIITSLDVTEEVVKEAVAKKSNLIVSHHPIIFNGLKKLTGGNYVERTIILALKNDVALYAIHTNLDNIQKGVNGKIAEKLGLVNCSTLVPKAKLLSKLYVYVPQSHAEVVRSAIFSAGGGNISNYSECSFNIPGTGTFKPGEGTHPFIGQEGVRHSQMEIKIEIIFPYWHQSAILAAMFKAHPYEEVAYEIINLENTVQEMGAGLTGYLPQSMDEPAFLELLKKSFNLSVIKHTRLMGNQISKVAVCGGAGSFMVEQACASGANIYITSDLKYHEYFDSNDRLVIADIGHYESEQFTIQLLYDILRKKFTTFAVLKTEIRTNPVYYFF